MFHYVCSELENLRKEAEIIWVVELNYWLKIQHIQVRKKKQP